ncbi:hypothetical protein [Mesoplasma melaleucae]|uniref:Uncharacterized protein n=1 Tax=Mesoplasma melaleucae TaxID=81459 RepID=A0A2K8NW94_9MOLU|nr:hypothetical protein [Mesoplasma melaleucae]ATZ18037.1 hypothetical protein EMELA_v1c04970 [Mesoplasma melaleucae]
MRNVSLDLINKINNYILVQKFSADATLAILKREILDYHKQIQEHIRKYAMYLIWLDDNKKDSAQAWEKYLARIEILEAKNNVKVVNEQKTKKLIQDLQDPYSLINKNKQKQKRLNSLSENVWKQEEEKMKPKQLSFEEVVSNDGEVLITNMKVETIDNDLLNETLEELTEDDTNETYNLTDENIAYLVESVNKTISDNFDKVDEIEFVEEEIVVLDDTLNGKHYDTFLNTADMDATNNDFIQTADYNELYGEPLSFEEPNKEIRFNSEEDKVHFLHGKHYIKEAEENEEDVHTVEKYQSAPESDFAEEDQIRTEDYEEFNELTTNSFLETNDVTLDSFKETDFTQSEPLKTAQEDFSTYEDLEEESISSEPAKTISNNVNNTILFGDIHEEFDQEIEKELTQIEETISNIESYTQKEKKQLDDLIFNEEERTLFQFEPEDLDVDDTMFENVTLASGVDQLTSTIDALKFLDDVEDKYESILSTDLDSEMIEDAREDSTIDALKFLDDVEDKYSDLFKDISDDEIDTIDNLIDNQTAN